MLDFFDFFLIGFVLAFIVRRLAPDLWPVGGHSVRLGHQRAVRFAVLGLDGGQDRPPQGHDPHRAELFARHRRDGANARRRLDLPRDMSFHRRLGRDRALLGRYHAGAGIRAASKRGWLTGLTTTMLPVGVLLGALLGGFCNTLYRLARPVRRRPAAGRTHLVYSRVGTGSPHWLMRMGRVEEARHSIAWALQIDPASIPLPTVPPVIRHTRWLELFKYPRSIIAGCLTGLTQTGGVGLTLWMVTLFVMVLRVSPPDASKLAIWVSLAAVAGRFFCSWISDAMGRRASGVLTCLIAALFMSLAGYMNSVFIGGISMFFVMIVLQNFFGSGNYSIVGPYMGELWPSSLRGSGMGLVYGVGNLGKFIGPAGLALIAGSSNFVAPKATIDAIIPAFNYFGFWYVLGALAFWYIGIETRGRTISEIDTALSATTETPVAAPVSRMSH